MKNLSTTSPATFETVWASFQETDRILSEKFAETERFLKEQFAETDRLQKENDRIAKEDFAELRRLQKENDRKLAETDRILSEKFAETDRLQKENERIFKEDHAKYEKRMKRMEKTMGSWAINHGSFAEEYFYNAFDEDKQDFFGEHFNEIEKNVKPKGKKLQDEYDIVMYNDSYVAIVETKFKAHKNDLQKVLKKAETFRILCPDYKDYKIYLGLASLSFNDELEQECLDQGIAIIKQVGDTVVINDDHLKVF